MRCQQLLRHSGGGCAAGAHACIRAAIEAGIPPGEELLEVGRWVNAFIELDAIMERVINPFDKVNELLEGFGGDPTNKGVYALSGTRAPPPPVTIARSSPSLISSVQIIVQ